MNAQNIDNKPKVQKESKNKIRVEFDRTPLKERLKAKFLSLFFLKKVFWYIFRLVLLVGISFVVLFPFFTKIAGSFMGQDDFVDVTVRLIPKNFTFETYKQIWIENKYMEAFFNTLALSLSSALIQTFVCCVVAYGLAKFKFKGIPEGCASTTIPVGTRGELQCGKAHIRCTLDESGPHEYEVEISDIHRDATSNKCFTVKVTDQELIAKTGGIIQGMSGSPIVQNGKLVGAVTHVLIGDPTSGYGIFVDNMLSQMGDLAG